MTRFLIILLFSFLSLTAAAERKVCESFDGDTILTDYTCPAGYRMIGTVNNGERRNWEWIQGTEEQRREQMEKARKLGESMANHLESCLY